MTGDDPATPDDAPMPAFGVDLPPVDFSELPPEGDWDTWALLAPVPSSDLPGDELMAALDEWARERDRRENLVRYARASLGLARSLRAVQDVKAVMADVTFRHEREVAEARAYLAAQEAMKAIDRLTTKARRRASMFTCRCPEGCERVNIYPRRSQPDPAGKPSLLVIAQDTQGRRHAAWLAQSPGEPASPEHLGFGCSHGAGTFPTAYPTYLTAGRHATRRVSDMSGVSWRPR